MNKIILVVVVIIVVIVGGYFLIQKPADNEENNMEETDNQGQEQVQEEAQELKIEVLQEGTGVEAKNGDNISVHYVGTLLDGTKFDSSIDRGAPFSFVLGQGNVIRGWELGLLGAKVGEKRKLTIPSDLAYGETGTPGGPIPANAALIFEVELLGINE